MVVITYYGFHVEFSGANKQPANEWRNVLGRRLDRQQPSIFASVENIRREEIDASSCVFFLFFLNIWFGVNRAAFEFGVFW